MITADNAGCWVDGSWGHYGPARLIQIALGHGWKDEDAQFLQEIYFGSNGMYEDCERIYDAADDAERWLNENVAPEDYSFGWYDGEFFLWNNEDWEAE